jgi:predicted DNA binding protein
MSSLRIAVIGSSHGCWACQSTEKFSGVSLEEAGPISLQHSNSCVHIRASWNIQADSASGLKEFVDHVNHLPSIRRAQLVSPHQGKGLLLTEWTHVNSSYDPVIKNNCIPIAPIVMEKGYDIHTVLCEKPKEVSRLLGSLNEIGDTKIFKVGKFLPEDSVYNLTAKQIQSLAIAAYNGYYSWPRRITLEELAKIGHMSRRAFQEHLRRAEAKALPSLVKGILASTVRDKKSNS